MRGVCAVFLVLLGHQALAEDDIVREDNLSACYTNSACMFPFIYHGVTYTQCTSIDHTNAWCATDTDDTNNYNGKWTDCHDKCGTKMCPTKITEACSSKGGFCVDEPFQDNCGNGTLKERACTSKHCQCCIPARAPSCDGKITSTCKKKGGSCVTAPFETNCDGKLSKTLCTGKDCQCCIPIKAPSCDGKIANACKKKGGHCVLAPFGDNCQDGKLIKNACKGKDCQCCVPVSVKTPSCDGKITNACTKKGGHCVLAPFEDNCQDGKLVKNACKGKDCQCCVPEKAPSCDGKLLNSCAQKGGHCVLAPFQDNCRGRLIERACTGANCQCCIPEDAICNGKLLNSCAKKGGHCVIAPFQDNCRGKLIDRACTGPNCQCCIPDPTPAPTVAPTQPPTPAPTKVQTHAATKPPPTQAPTQPPTPPPTQPPTTPAPPKPTTQPPTPPPTQPPPTQAPTQPPTPPPTQPPPTQAPTQPPTPPPTQPPPTQAPTQPPPQPPTQPPTTPAPPKPTTQPPTPPPIQSLPTQAPTQPPTPPPTQPPPTPAPPKPTTQPPTPPPTQPPPTQAPTHAPTPAPTNPPTNAPPQPTTVAPKPDCYTNSACMFPFIYHGVTYTQCTSDDHTNVWCATDTDDNYNYNGKWTDCREKCADPKVAPTVAPTQPPTPAPTIVQTNAATQPPPTQAPTQPPSPAPTNPPTTAAPPQPTTLAPLPATPCPELFSLQGSQCLHVNTVDTLSWEEARDACAAKGNRLLVPTDVNEFKEFANANYNGKQFWLGASDLESEGHWVWLNGEPLQAGFPWAMFQPDNWFNEDCLMYPHFGAYNDFQCHHKLHYICEACPTGYVLVGAQCLSFNTEEELNWQEASDKCEANGDSLAVIKDFEHLQQYIGLNYGGAGEIYFWLGGSKSQPQVTWRDDYRCGSAFPLANGAPSTCYPNGGIPCCSSHNWCGISDEHCTCSDCQDFTGAPLTRYYGPQSKIWHHDDCKTIGVHSDKSVTECKAICDTTSGCTAINYKEDMCIMRECTSPVPQPMWDNSPWVGYSKVTSDWVWVNGGDMSNIPWGPNEPNNVGGEEGCFNFITAHGYNDDNCSKKSFFVCSNGM